MGTNMRFWQIGLTNLLLSILLLYLYFFSSNEKFAFLFGIVYLIGFGVSITTGMMYKIVPFLVWYHKYSSKVGLEKVPMLKEMFNENYAEYGFYIMITAVIGTVASLLFRSEVGLLISFSLMFFSSLIFSFNMITIFRK